MITKTKATETRSIPLRDIRPNDYNPNAMTDDEFAELVAEVRYLGRLPKPVVVRPCRDGFQIVDGEHGWKAAQDVGLTEIPCEVVEADDFEAMRQTYKRNQHGTHNPVRLGKMFEQMMAERSLSQRKLAEETDVSEGTIRNALEYAKAAKLRNDYAFEDLSIKQVRTFNRLPPTIGGWWLSAGANLKVLFNVKWSEHVDRTDEWTEKRLTKELADLEESGLVEFIGAGHGRYSFEGSIKKLRGWDKWERSWCVAGIERETLREYTRHYFRDVWYVRDEHMMESALEWLVDRHTGKFLLSPQEFADCIEATKLEKSSAHDFQKRLEFLVYEKHGRKPDSQYHVQRDLMKLEVDREAPDFIKQSKLPVQTQHDLLRLHRRLQSWEKNGPRNPFDFGPSYTVEALKVIAVGNGCKRESVNVTEWDANATQGRMESDAKIEEQIATMTEEDLAESFIGQMYGEDRNEAVEAFRKKLATFDKAELLVLNEVIGKILGLAERRAECEAKIEAAMGRVRHGTEGDD